MISRLTLSRRTTARERRENGLPGRHSSTAFFAGGSSVSERIGVDGSV